MSKEERPKSTPVSRESEADGARLTPICAYRCQQLETTGRMKGFLPAHTAESATVGSKSTKSCNQLSGRTTSQSTAFEQPRPFDVAPRLFESGHHHSSGSDRTFEG